MTGRKLGREGRVSVLPLIGLYLLFTPPPLSSLPPAGVSACLPCHRDVVDSYTGTAHFAASRIADGQSIKGSFAEGKNVLRTQVENIFFRMEQRPNGFYQTGFEEKGSRTERFDLVIGSGRRGQSYLFWKNDLLYQLPVSYLVGAEEWVNSPGYRDGTVHFDRGIPPRCLECHATYFRLEGGTPAPRYANDYVLGITCQKCHGSSPDHRQIRNPAGFARERQLDLCGLCHSGNRDARKASFTYQPGADLADYLQPEQVDTAARPDVHGNQVGLLRRSRCFQESSRMSCSTCHQVHEPGRDPGEMSRKCVGCHDISRCKQVVKSGSHISGACVECHMPVEKSRVIRIDRPERQFAQEYRSHAIGIYPQSTARVLERLRKPN